MQSDNKIKFVYVLTSSEKDIYYEQFLLSLASMRLYNPVSEVIVLVDNKTKAGLKGKRSEYEKLVSEIMVIAVPGEFSQKEVSRWIKTSVHHYVTGNFLFIDCDTIITKKLQYDDFPPDIKVGAVLDKHAMLDKHYLRDYFIKEDTGAGFCSSIKSNTRFNGGLILCVNDPQSLEFHEKWHSLWLESLKKGCSQDMPALNQANYEMGSIIHELGGEWNCQISHNGLIFLHNAKIIHYFATTLVSLDPPYKLASSSVFSSIKKEGTVSPEIYSLLQNPLSAFEENSRIISDERALEVLDSALFRVLLWLRNKHYIFFKIPDSFVRSLIFFLKKIIKKR
jgi:hypothetical protein